nr:glycosyltransferase family 4 protein [Lachnoclostridium phocaeense]
MKVAILCNGKSSRIPDRKELIEALHNIGVETYIGAVYDGKVSEYYTNTGTNLLTIEASRNNMNPFVELKSLFNVKRKVEKAKIDAAIIYGVKNHPAMTIGVKLAGVKNIICVVNGRGNLFKIKGIKGTLLRFISLPMLFVSYQLSNYICFQNADDKEFFCKKHLIISQKKIFVTGGSGVNINRFAEYPLPKENKFLFLARITASKGIKEYINAARIVKDLYPESKFEVVGPIDTEVENECRKELEDAVKDKLVIYHGEAIDVRPFLKKCRVFIYPSYYPEGVPRSLLEAMATGRPIITCETPGCKDTVDNKNGFLVPPQNVSALAEKMIWMIKYPEKTQEMGKHSRELVCNKFNVFEINKILIEKLLE